MLPSLDNLENPERLTYFMGVWGGGDAINTSKYENSSLLSTYYGWKIVKK